LFAGAILYILICGLSPERDVIKDPPQRVELKMIHDLFRLRNEHKADSVEKYYADTVAVYMKFLRNVPKKKITRVDKEFWKAHPNNKFEITAPVKITDEKDFVKAIIFGNEYLDGKSFVRERIEIRFNRKKKIFYYRGFLLKK